MKFSGILLSLSFLSLLLTARSEAMSLDAYLSRVEEKNGLVKSHRLNEDSYQLRMAEGDLITSWNLFASGQLMTDKKASQNPLFEGTKRTQDLFQLGFEQQSSYGVHHKLYYAHDRTALFGVDPTFFQTPEVAKSSFNYEVVLPLWRNQFGKSTRDQIDSVKEQNLSESLSARFSRKQIRANAISAYWRVKAAQELNKLLDEQLQSNLTFLNWTSKRVRDRLGEDTDLRQAEAAVALRRYEIESAKAELLEATQAFNLMQQEPAEAPVPELSPLPELQKPTVPADLAGAIRREDIQSLEALLKVENAQSRIAAETSRALLDLNALFSTNGLDVSDRESFRKSLRTDHPSYTVGVKFSIPLDRSSVNDMQRSAQARTASVETRLERKKYEVAAEFESLKRNYTQLVTIYELAKTVEKAQRLKYQTESERRRIGRTTTFQLLSFQQEHQQSKQALIRAQSAVLQLDAQFKLFDMSSEDNT